METHIPSSLVRDLQGSFGVPRFDNGSSSLASVTDISAVLDGRIHAVGYTGGSWGRENVGDNDFLSLILDTGSVGTSAPSPAVVVTEEPQPKPFPSQFQFPPTMSPSAVDWSLVPTSAPSPAPSFSEEGSSSNFFSSYLGFATIAGTVVLIMGLVCWRKLIARNIIVFVTRLHAGTRRVEEPSDRRGNQRDRQHALIEVTEPRQPLPIHHATAGHSHGIAGDLETNTTGERIDVSGLEMSVTVVDSAISRGTASGGSGIEVAPRNEGVLGGSREPRTLSVTAPTGNTPTEGTTDDCPAGAVVVGEISVQNNVEKTDSKRGSSVGGISVAQAVVNAASALGEQSGVGVAEAAMLVSILVSLVADDRSSTRNMECSVKRCRSIVWMLEGAAKVPRTVRETLI